MTSFRNAVLATVVGSVTAKIDSARATAFDTRIVAVARMIICCGIRKEGKDHKAAGEEVSLHPSTQCPSMEDRTIEDGESRSGTRERGKDDIYGP